MTTKTAGRNRKRSGSPNSGPHTVRRTKARQKGSFLALEDDLRAIGMQVPAEEWLKLPKDFNENLDHYLYGSPKRKPSKG
jgi:hypothetical protein